MSFAELRPQTGIVGLWHLNGNATDSSGNGYNGTVTSIDYVDGVFGQGASFNAVSDNISTGNIATLNPATNFSVCAWVVPSAFASENMVIEKRRNTGSSPYNSYGLIINSAAKATFVTSANSADVNAIGTTVLQTGKRYFLVGTYDGSNNRIYVNGNKEATQAQTGNITYGTTALSIGYGAQSLSQRGVIDEVAIFSRVLTDNEIKKMYGFMTGKL